MTTSRRAFFATLAGAFGWKKLSAFSRPLSAKPRRPSLTFDRIGPSIEASIHANLFNPAQNLHAQFMAHRFSFHKDAFTLDSWPKR